MKVSNKVKQSLRAKYGKWVLITGASSGIGKEIALKFAEAGFNLIITGRREEILNSYSQQLIKDYGIEAIPVQGDLSRMEDIKQLIKACDPYPVGISILNAGYGSSGKFIETDIDQELNMLDLNCKAIFILSHHFARKMKERGQGAIVLMSSMVAFQGVPNAANYAASKAYVQSFGEAIALELKAEGVDILCAAPGPVESGFSKRADMQMGLALKPEDVAVPIIHAIGKKTTVLPGFLTKFLVYNLRLTPRWGKIRIMGKVMEGFTKHQYA